MLAFIKFYFPIFARNTVNIMRLRVKKKLFFKERKISYNVLTQIYKRLFKEFDLKIDDIEDT